MLVSALEDFKAREGLMKVKDKADLDRILDELDVDHIPAEFVKSARIVYTEGGTQHVSANELENIMNHEASLEEMGIKDIGLVLDLDTIKTTIREYSDAILQEIGR
jgi:hypothetical protein